MHEYTFIQQFFPNLTSHSSYNVRAPFDPTKYEVEETQSDLLDMQKLDIQNDLIQLEEGD